MPFDFDPRACAKCRFNYCVEDLRKKPVRGRNTKFRLKQDVALACTFEGMVPGFHNDPQPAMDFDHYMGRFRSNLKNAGKNLFGRAFEVSDSAIAKVEGDVFELLEAAALWEVAAAWNQFMDSGKWNAPTLTSPHGAVSAPDRKVAFVKLPRNYDATLLFTEAARKNIRAHEAALNLRKMELGLSSPDIVGVRLTTPLPNDCRVFASPLKNLDEPNRKLLETAYQRVEGTLSGREFLFAIAVKRTTRSDRLYQPLFEANVLKYLIQDVLRGAAFRFHVHVGSFEGADVEGHYRAASLFSLLRGGEPSLAVDRLIESKQPVALAQAVLDDLPLFPL